MLLEYENRKVKVQSVKAAMMGRRPTSIHIELRDIETGKISPARFSPSERIERVMLDTISYLVLYFDKDIACLMHPTTFEQIEVPVQLFQNGIYYIPDSYLINIFFYNNEVFSVDLPDFVLAKIISCNSNVCLLYIYIYIYCLFI